MLCFGVICFTHKSAGIKNRYRERFNHFSKNEASCVDLGHGWLLHCPDQYSRSTHWSVLTSSNSILIGKAFKKDDYSSIQDSDLPRSIEQYDTFSQRHWGDYLLIIIDKDKKVFKCFRSPSCQLPFYYCENEGIISFSTSIDLLQSILSSSFQFHWDYLLSYLYGETPLGSSTPFKEIAELPLGCCIQLGTNKRSVTVHWNPADYIDKYHHRSIQEDSELLYQTLSNVLKSWSSGIHHTYLEFSGGIDSSSLHFVLSEIAHPKDQYQSVHLFNPSNYACNESDIAEELAQMTHTSLTKINYLTCLPCSRSSLQFRPDKPAIILLYQEQERAFLELTDKNGRFLFINGHGGDNILMSNPYYSILFDSVLSKGFKGSFDFVKDFATFYRTNIYEVLGGFFRAFFLYLRGVRPDTKDPYFFAPWLQINPRTYYKYTEFHHPFYTIRKHLLPGKMKQIDDLYEVLKLIYTVNIRSPGNYKFYPFLAQPVVELLLSIPTYHLFHATYDRYIMRKAISDRFRASHIWRRDKGEFSNINMLGLEKNQAYIADLLLNGTVVSKGYINRELLEKSISDLIAGDGRLQWPILRLITLEMFLNYWL